MNFMNYIALESKFKVENELLSFLSKYYGPQPCISEIDSMIKEVKQNNALREQWEQLANKYRREESTLSADGL